jgi:hypothetical protein
MPHFGFEAYGKGFFSELLHRGDALYRLKGFKAARVRRYAPGRQNHVVGAIRRCQTRRRENKQFYHDRCIAATPSNFLLQESKYGFAGAKSLCYSRPEVGIFNAYKKTSGHSGHQYAPSGK